MTSTLLSRSLPALALISLLQACAPSTSIVQSWRDPAVTIPEGSFHKILAIALVKDETTRRIAEDRLVDFLNGRGVASYSYLGTAVEVINEAEVQQRMKQNGFDGVIIMRLVDRTKEQTYVPGTAYPSYYGSPWGYYGYAYPMYSDPGYVQTNVTYYVETNLYSTTNNKLIWSGTTSTMNPTDVGNSVDEIAHAVYNRMISEGFIQKAPPPPAKP